MKNTVLLSLLLFMTTLGYAQETSPESSQEIIQLQKDIKELKEDFKSLSITTQKNSRKLSAIGSTLNTAKNDIKDLGNELDKTNSTVSELKGALDSVNSNLSTNISNVKQVVDKNEKHFNEEIKEKVLYGAIFLICSLILGLAFFLLLKKRMSNNLNVIEKIKNAQDDLRKAQTTIEEESVKLNNQMVEIIEKQLNSSTQLKVNNPTDHSLALKVADEIVRIELNLSRMDPSIKGHKQLSKGIERIKNNFLAKGYDIADMLNKPYNEGMRINADFVLDENMEPGARIITSITKPQVTYNGELIQKAIVTVTQNI